MSEGFWGRQAAFIKKLSRKDQIVLLGGLILIAAVIVSLTPNMAPAKKPSQEGPGEISSQEYCKWLEDKLEDILELVPGVGKVKAMITLDGEIGKEIAYNETNSHSSSGDASSKTSEQSTVTKEAVLERDGTTTTPYIVSDKYPVAVSAIIAAEGAGDPVIQELITDAVIKSMNIPAHRIKVMPRK
ncbi:MAG: hypothetical protein FWG30_03555 [Eubacteriaceae bacterium]|jgi:stage III sporulation protein AG|nr:hypothetical protein [Eubacteriaceae bacterium]